jgi:hypothetical protein
MTKYLGLLIPIWQQSVIQGGEELGQSNEGLFQVPVQCSSHKPQEVGCKWGACSLAFPQ